MASVFSPRLHFSFSLFSGPSLLPPSVRPSFSTLPAAQAAKAYERKLESKQPDFFNANADAADSGSMGAWTPRDKSKQTPGGGPGRTTRDLFPGVDAFQDYAERITQDLEKDLGIGPRQVDEDGNPIDDDDNKKNKKGKKNKKK